MNRNILAIVLIMLLAGAALAQTRRAAPPKRTLGKKVAPAPSKSKSSSLGCLGSLLAPTPIPAWALAKKRPLDLGRAPFRRIYSIQPGRSESVAKPKPAPVLYARVLSPEKKGSVMHLNPAIIRMISGVWYDSHFHHNKPFVPPTNMIVPAPTVDLDILLKSVTYSCFRGVREVRLDNEESKIARMGLESLDLMDWRAISHFSGTNNNLWMQDRRVGFGIWTVYGKDGDMTHWFPSDLILFRVPYNNLPKSKKAPMPPSSSILCVSTDIELDRGEEYVLYWMTAAAMDYVIEVIEPAVSFMGAKRQEGERRIIARWTFCPARRLYVLPQETGKHTIRIIHLHNSRRSLYKLTRTRPVAMLIAKNPLGYGRVREARSTPPANAKAPTYHPFP